jgi:hypothetical protein
VYLPGGPTARQSGGRCKKRADLSHPSDDWSMIGTLGTYECLASNIAGAAAPSEPWMTRSLHDALDETIAFIERALGRIRADEGAEAELHNLRAYLVNVLDLVERDPGIEAASDDLYAVARRLAEGSDKGPRMRRLLVEAFQRFHDRLSLARPSERALQMGLS